MKIKNIKVFPNEPLLVSIVGERFFRLERDIKIVVERTDGTIVYDISKGFVTDFRSGGPLIDKFIAQFGNMKMQLAYICHDVAYTPMVPVNSGLSSSIQSCFDSLFGKLLQKIGYSEKNQYYPIAKKTADLLLKEMLRNANVGRSQIQIVYRVLRIFGCKAYWCGNEYTETNSMLYKIAQNSIKGK